jgi:ethanolamine utilization protein EutN
MQMARVIATATSTVKHPTFAGERLLIVELLAADGRAEGEPVIVFDRLGARRGDEVVVTNDGRALQEMLGRDTPGRWSVLGIPDS